jgi:hypothetical protein
LPPEKPVPLRRSGARRFARVWQSWPASTIDPQTRRLWVCYYDTSGDPSRKQARYACTSSRDGRRWSRPVRAAAFSADVESLWEDARIYGFGHGIGYGGYTAVVAEHGIAHHPLWIDPRDVTGRAQEVFTALVR